MGLTKYLKAAFLNQWNMLAFLGGMGFALLSGHPDIFAPLVLAGEVGYLGFLGTHPRFQKYVEAQEAKANRQDGSQDVESMFRKILNTLPRNLAKRFESLCAQCAELRQLAVDMRGPQFAGEAPPLEDLQLGGLDRLLWIYLRLLFTQNSLERFQTATNADEIRRQIADIEARLKKVQDNPKDLQNQRLAKVLEDSLETARARLANFQKAADNYELVLLEIDRLENKIRSLSELAVNRQEPEFISGQIDQAADSMVQTEKTIGELEFVTGLHSSDEEVPQILRRATGRVRE